VKKSNRYPLDALLRYDLLPSNCLCACALPAARCFFIAPDIS
jgi:hypothetical protein